MNESIEISVNENDTMKKIRNKEKGIKKTREDNDFQDKIIDLENKLNGIYNKKSDNIYVLTHFIEGVKYVATYKYSSKYINISINNTATGEKKILFSRCKVAKSNLVNCNFTVYKDSSIKGEVLLNDVYLTINPNPQKKEVEEEKEEKKEEEEEKEEKKEEEETKKVNPSTQTKSNATNENGIELQVFPSKSPSSQPASSKPASSPFQLQDPKSLSTASLFLNPSPQQPSQPQPSQFSQSSQPQPSQSSQPQPSQSSQPQPVSRSVDDLNSSGIELQTISSQHESPETTQIESPETTSPKPASQQQPRKIVINFSPNPLINGTYTYTSKNIYENDSNIKDPENKSEVKLEYINKGRGWFIYHYVNDNITLLASKKCKIACSDILDSYKDWIIENPKITLDLSILDIGKYNQLNNFFNKHTTIYLTEIDNPKLIFGLDKLQLPCKFVYDSNIFYYKGENQIKDYNLYYYASKQGWEICNNKDNKHNIIAKHKCWKQMQITNIGKCTGDIMETQSSSWILTNGTKTKISLSYTESTPQSTPQSTQSSTPQSTQSSTPQSTQSSTPQSTQSSTNKDLTLNFTYDITDLEYVSQYDATTKKTYLIKLKKNIEIGDGQNRKISGMIAAAMVNDKQRGNKQHGGGLQITKNSVVVGIGELNNIITIQVPANGLIDDKYFMLYYNKNFIPIPCKEFDCWHNRAYIGTANRTIKLYTNIVINPTLINQYMMSFPHNACYDPKVQYVMKTYDVILNNKIITYTKNKPDKDKQQIIKELFKTTNNSPIYDASGAIFVTFPGNLNKLKEITVIMNCDLFNKNFIILLDSPIYNKKDNFTDDNIGSPIVDSPGRNPVANPVNPVASPVNPVIAPVIAHLVDSHRQGNGLSQATDIGALSEAVKKKINKCLKDANITPSNYDELYLYINVALEALSKCNIFGTDNVEKSGGGSRKKRKNKQKSHKKKYNVKYMSKRHLRKSRRSRRRKQRGGQFDAAQYVSNLYGNNITEQESHLVNGALQPSPSGIMTADTYQGGSHRSCSHRGCSRKGCSRKGGSLGFVEANIVPATLFATSMLYGRNKKSRNHIKTKRRKTRRSYR
jgi:hypothetical protein